MSNMISLSSGGKTVKTEQYTPQETAPRGLVVIGYGSDGLTDDLNGPWATMTRGYATALADRGFAALIPDYLAFTNTPPGPAALEMIAIRRDAWSRALSDVIDQAAASLLIAPGQVGLLGLSLGGHLCLRLRSKAKVLVAFFAPSLDGIGAPGSLTHAQIHHGQADRVPGTGVENAEAIAAVLRSEGTETEVHLYPGAGHGFIGDDLANTEARDQSMERTLAFFQAKL